MPKVLWDAFCELQNDLAVPDSVRYLHANLSAYPRLDSISIPARRSMILFLRRCAVQNGEQVTKMHYQAMCRKVAPFKLPKPRL